MRMSRSGLLVIELVIAVGIFSLCAAICIGLFVQADRVSRESDMLSRAVSAAQNVAEQYKAADGDLGRLAEACGALQMADGSLTLAFDAGWLQVDPADGAASYRPTVTPETAQGYQRASLTVRQAGSDEALYTLPLAAEGRP